MKKKDPSRFLFGMQHIYQEAQAAYSIDRCVVAPSPQLRDQIKAELANQRKAIQAISGEMLSLRHPLPPGMNDGLIYPGNVYSLGTSVAAVKTAAADRSPLSGIVRVIVVLVQFSDQAMTATQNHFEELFFSTGVLPNGSVREYYQEVSHGIIDIQGEVVGPYLLPQTMVEYAHGASGIGSTLPNARTMARHAAEAANPAVNFAPYDNDADNYVDAFIVIHAGPGAEVTGNSDHIWSHKWVLSGGAYNADGTNIYAYLTVPEDSKIGVCCHELGHLLFGWPDLYDTDYSSEGVGNWCLMAGGSWNGGGEIPAHASAWCKAQQGWVTVQQPTSNATINISDVKNSHTVYRLWKDGTSGNEYFLVENRQKTDFDKDLPGSGLLIWHIDEAISSNTNENHYKVALVQADGLRNLENGDNRGDAGDPYPGTASNTSFNSTSTPNSRSYGGVDTCVAINNISPSGPIMSAELVVQCKIKEGKEGKEFFKDFKDYKDRTKEYYKELKDLFEQRPAKQAEKAEEKIAPEGAGTPWALTGAPESHLEARVAALEAWMAAVQPFIQPFIDTSLRPDLRKSALSAEEDLDKTQKNAADTKRSTDTKGQDL